MTMRGHLARLASHLHSGDSRAAGFSTLESIVAVGILAIALLPLYDFQLTIVDGTRRLEGQFGKTTTHQKVDDYLKSLQPVDLGKGSEQLGPIALTWTVEPGPISRPVLTGNGLSGRFSLSLVTIRYNAESDQGITVEGALTRLFWTETAPFFSP